MSGCGDSEKAQYEERLRRRLKILRQELQEGKVSLPDDPEIIDALESVRFGGDGEIDLDTVRPVVRSLALAITSMRDRDDLKRAHPLDDVQHVYFEFIYKNFGSYYDFMVKNGLTPHDVATALSGSESYSSGIVDQIPHFIDVIKEFWASVGDSVYFHIEDMPDISKAVFGGDLFPAHEQNIASKCGVYADTIILPDPFLRSADLFELWPTSRRVYFFIKHAMNILQYSTLACAGLDTPIIVVVPDHGALHQDERDFYVNLGAGDSLEHAAHMFGRDFESIDDLMDFSENLDSVDKVVSSLVDDSRVLFDSDVSGGAREQINFALAEYGDELLGTTHPGVIVASHAMGRMTVSNELLVKARRMRATPIIDAPTSWKYFNWKLEYDSGKAELDSSLSDLHVLKGLQSLSEGEMEWLGKVPPDALIELRKSGALAEIRSILAGGIEDVSSANPCNFHRTTDQVFSNIESAFDEHKQKIKELSKKKWRFAGTDIASWLVVGSLEVSAAATGTPVWGLTAVAANQFFDVPKLKDIPVSIRELAEESRRVQRSPVGMLFSCTQS